MHPSCCSSMLMDSMAGCSYPWWVRVHFTCAFNSCIKTSQSALNTSQETSAPAASTVKICLRVAIPWSVSGTSCSGVHTCTMIAWPSFILSPQHLAPEHTICYNLMRQVETLKTHFQCFALDLPGHGQAETLADDVKTAQQLAELVLETVEVLGLRGGCWIQLGRKNNCCL